MSPPLETTNTNHEKLSSSTGSLGVDIELNLLSSPKNSAENDQQAMDLFLNQVAEYNAQQLSFDQQHASSSSSHTHTMGKVSIEMNEGKLPSTFFLLFRFLASLSSY